mmetsp:Transcript_48875/g.114764  ORF Transcript_48875/g.114764 Transcript_48875/m.114764 type:complete len:294 (-) Transcript_48875:203-1084(-)
MRLCLSTVVLVSALLLASSDAARRASDVTRGASQGNDEFLQEKRPVATEDLRPSGVITEEDLEALGDQVQIPKEGVENNFPSDDMAEAKVPQREKPVLIPTDEDAKKPQHLRPKPDTREVKTQPSQRTPAAIRAQKNTKLLEKKRLATERRIAMLKQQALDQAKKKDLRHRKAMEVRQRQIESQNYRRRQREAQQRAEQERMSQMQERRKRQEETIERNRHQRAEQLRRKADARMRAEAAEKQKQQKIRAQQQQQAQIIRAQEARHKARKEQQQRVAREAQLRHHQQNAQRRQ